MTRQINIALVGHGSVADYVVKQVTPIEGINIVALICRECSLAQALEFAADRFPVFTNVAQMQPKPDLLVDCAGHSGLQCHAPAALEIGIDVISLSTGALAQQGVAENLEFAAQAGGSCIRFLSGAVGGIDALASAASGEIEEVIYKGSKPPRGWVGSPAEQKCDLASLTEPFEHFSGTAREAAALYPKNANVAATIALASVGLDKVSVRLIADPGLDQNIHEIEALGSFGRLSFRIEARSLPSNPRTSALAAMSIVGELKQRIRYIGI